MSDILQSSLPYAITPARRLPGIAPFDMADWLIVDDAYSAQMHERARLLATRRDDVLVLDPGARAAADELLQLVLDMAYAGPESEIRGTVVRPDGSRVAINRDDPLGTMGHLVQEDLCILQKIGGVHVLTGAVLCFPASWTLSEKFMHPLVGIHSSVDAYDDGIAKRVQRLFDGVRVGRPMWRFNALWYHDADLYQPRRVADPRAATDTTTAAFFRSERQCILRLPQSDAVVFSIHTFVLARAAVRTAKG